MLVAGQSAENAPQLIMMPPKNLKKLLSPVDNQPGRRHILLPDEEIVLVSRIPYTLQRGFGMDIDQVQESIGEIANDLQENYANILPSLVTLCRFRPQHRDINYRVSQSKELAKIVAENSEYAKTLNVALESVHVEYTDIFEDAGCIYNMYETSIYRKD